MLRRVTIILAFLLLTVTSWSQKTKVYGTVIDSTFQQGLPGVVVKFKGTKIGTTADMEGNYVIETYYASDTLEFFYPTFETQYFVIEKDKSQEINVVMKEATEDLPTVVVTPTERENPAHPILRAVIRNKKINNREKLDAYEYEVYNKLEFDINNITEEFTKRRAFRKFDFIFDNIDTTDAKPYLPVFMTESLSDYYYRKTPKKTKEIIKATRVSGVNNESVSQFTGDMYQQVNIYENHVPVFGKNFISPIANNGLAHYKYYLMDSMVIDGRFCYQLRFMPKRKQELTFYGDMWVNDTTYAIKKIEGTIASDANINFVKDLKVTQEFDQVEDEVWMLTRDELWVDFALRDKDMGFYGRKSTSYNQFVINQPRTNEFFIGVDNIVVLDGANEKGNEFWEQSRHDTLTANQKGVFQMMDTLGKMPIIKSYIDLVYLLVGGYKKLGPVEIGPYASIYSYNPVEGSRLQLGIRTSNDFSKLVEFSGYGAYGLADEKWKYGIGTRFFITKKPRRMVRMVYKNDIEQLGLSQNAFRSDNVLSSFLLRKGNRLDRLSKIEEYRVSYEREWFQGLSSVLLFRRSSIGPLGSIPNFLISNGLSGPENVKQINLSEITLRTRWAHKEQYLSGEFNRMSLGTKKPVFTAQYTLGLKGVLNSDFEYHKLVLGLQHKIPMGILGNTRYGFEVGKIWGALPYPLLEIHAGNITWVYNDYAYNMMNLIEFVSDEYAALNFEHHFNGLFLNKIPLMRKLKWREVATVKAVYGRLDQRHRDLMELPTFTRSLQDKPYVEAAAGVENIFKIFRIDFLWRLSYLDNSLPGANVSKFGIRGKLQVDF